MSGVVTMGPALDLRRFEPVSLAELQARAELLTRRDRKYLVSDAELERLLADLPAGGVLEIDGRQRFAYDTVYFDTPDLRSYLDAARGRPARWKVRTRTYREQGETWTELKVRDRRGRTAKHRLRRDTADPWELSPIDRAFAATHADGCRLDGDVIARLDAVLATSYERVTLLDPTTAGRVTIDLGLRGTLADGSSVELDGAAVVETKSAGHALVADRLLWRMRRRPLRLSKYCTSFAALHPDLPAQRWHRTLRTAPYRAAAA